MKSNPASLLNVYASNHINSQTVCKAFAQGADAPIVPSAPLLPGSIAMYGCLRGLEPTLRQAQMEKRDWYYIDNGYIKPGHYDGYYRITRNAYQIDGAGKSYGWRYARLGINANPWRIDGRHIVFCPPSEVWCGIIGINREAFIADTLYKIKVKTKRKVVTRAKASGRSLELDLQDAWCLVTYSSNAAVEAAIAGIPVICLGRCAASAISGTINDIETPPTPDRANWLGVLADNQFTLEEMRNGTCWRQIRAVY